jgi:hypothetical protein
LIRFRGAGGVSVNGATRTPITGSYTPIGAKTVTVQPGHSFAVGEWVALEHIPNQAWIDLISMTAYWQPSNYDYRAERRVVAVSGDAITLDAPVMDAIDATYATANLVKISADARIENVGIENLRLTSLYTSNTDEDHGWSAVIFDHVKNGWARNVEAYYFGYSAVNINSDSNLWITVDSCKMIDPKSKVEGGRRYSFPINGQRCLVMNCISRNGGRHDYVSGSNTVGPSVFFNNIAEKVASNHDSGPHHRWTVGHLYDNVVTDQNLNVQNRLASGTGHGWAGSQIMLWNCTSNKTILQNPAGPHINWAIGHTGQITNVGQWITTTLGFVESQGNRIAAIPSLFLAQLSERLGGGPLVTEVPVFTPVPGAYSSAQSVTISSPTIGARVNYTTDGSEPSDTHGTPFTGPITVSSSSTIKAVAYSDILPSSPVVTGQYMLVSGGVTVSEEQGLYNLRLAEMQPSLFVVQLDISPSATESLIGFGLGNQSSADGLAVAVRFNSAGFIDAINGSGYSAASAIPYTQGGSYRLRFVINAPTRTYSAYVTPAGSPERTIGVNYAFRSSQAGVGVLDTVSMQASGGSIYAGPLSIVLRPAAAAAATPAGGTYSSVQTVTLSSRTANALIRYTMDGSIPTPTSGTLYTGPITINRNTTLKTIAYGAGSAPSSVTTANYTIILPAAAPTFTPPGGFYRAAQAVALGSSTPGSSIRYTTDGSVPTPSTGILYTSPINVSGNTTLKAVTFAAGFSPSPVSTSTYVISDLPQDFVNLPLPAAQSDVFKLEFDATPSGPDSILGLSLGNQSDVEGMAAAVNFGLAGVIEARNGDSFTAASSIAYTAGTKYRFRFVVDLTTRTYSAYVTPEGGSTQLIGKHYAFGTAQAAITSLDTLGIATTHGPVQIGPLDVIATTEPAVWTSAGPTTFTGANSESGPVTAGSAPSLTVAFFATPAQLGNMGPVDKLPATGTAGWTTKLRANGQLWFRIGSEASGSRTDVTASNVYTAGNRVHIACTFTGGTAVIYVNGVAVTTRTGITHTVNNTTTALRLGIPSVAATSNVYIGTLERVKIYGTALNAAQIGLLAD